MFRLQLAAVLLGSVVCLLAPGCGHARGKNAAANLIVLGVDGMDPAFVERHWDALPNLRALRDCGYFGRLGTSMPPQSPVAWSTFITGLEPDQHGLYDFVHRDPATLQLFSSMSKTSAPRWVLPFGPYAFPLRPAQVSSMRRGTPFWRTLAEHGVPVMVQRMPTNYPPDDSGRELAGMGTPDLLGTQGTFTFYTDDPEEVPRQVPGGRIVKTGVSNGRAVLLLEGPPNPLLRDHAVTTAAITLDVDRASRAARIEVGDQTAIVREGEWSGWLRVKFPLIAHADSIHGMVRVFAKQLSPGLEIYVSPINADPAAPDLPISSPRRWAADLEDEAGPYFTLGIPEDTAALRQEVLSLPQFQEQAQLVFAEEARLLEASLRQFTGGFLFFYFSSIDQNSHVLWGQHEDELLKVYREVDGCVGEVRRQHPEAELLIISDHGFTTFDRAVHLNAWLKQQGFLALKAGSGRDAGMGSIDWSATEAYAVGLNALYLNHAGRERYGTVPEGQAADALVAKLRGELLEWRDGTNGKRVIETVMATHPAAANRDVAPDLLIGYAPGYRASWQTGLGDIPDELIEDNTDAWIGDHCINPADVPGVLFSNRRIEGRGARLQDVTASILKRFGIPPPAGYRGSVF